MSEHKVTTYLLYALGEILLVVIGILIAVSIDDWNEERIAKSKQRKQLELIRNEMAFNLVLLQEESKKLENRLSKQLDFINLINDKNRLAEIPDSLYSKMYWEAYNDRVLTAIENTALNEMVAAGGLKDIQNDSIRIFLSSWGSRLAALRNQEAYVLENDRHLTEFLMLNPTFSFRQYLTTVFPDRGVAKPSKPISNKNIQSLQQFENILITIYGQSNRMFRTYYTGYKEDLIKIIEALDNELN